MAKLNRPHQKRAKLIERDGNRCFYCDKDLNFYQPTIDHIIPRSQGGSGALDNLVLACFPCNNHRGNMSADEWIRRVRGSTLKLELLRYSQRPADDYKCD